MKGWYKMKTTRKFRNMNAEIITEGNIETLKSYNSNIIRIDRDKMIMEIGADFDYSRSTSKQINFYFRDEWGVDIGVADIRKALKNNTKLMGYYTVIKNDKL